MLCIYQNPYSFIAQRLNTNICKLKHKQIIWEFGGVQDEIKMVTREYNKYMKQSHWREQEEKSWPK